MGIRPQSKEAAEEWGLEGPPWERGGTLRRDVAPPRGQQLRLLAMTGVYLSLFLCFPLPGLTWSLVVLVLAERDLAAMAKDQMDPQGHRATQITTVRAGCGIMLAGCATICLLVPFVLLVIRAVA